MPASSAFSIRNLCAIGGLSLLAAAAVAQTVGPAPPPDGQSPGSTTASTARTTSPGTPSGPIAPPVISKPAKSPGPEARSTSPGTPAANRDASPGVVSPGTPNPVVDPVDATTATAPGDPAPAGRAPPVR